RPVTLIQLIGLDLLFHRLSCTAEINRTLWVTHGKRQSPVDELLGMISPESRLGLRLSTYLYILARLNFSSESTVLRQYLLLGRDVLDPMDILSSTATHLSLDGE